MADSEKCADRGVARDFIWLIEILHPVYFRNNLQNAVLHTIMDKKSH